jgi:tryptophan halogenase
MPAADLIRLVKTLGAPYGFERSVKLMPGDLADDRCLISLGRAALGNDPARRLVGLGQELGIPKEFENNLPESLDRADIVHFGYEAAAGLDSYKLYFEYAGDTRRAMASPNASPVLVHLAYKWTPSRPNSRVVTRYTWMPCPTRAALEAKVRDLVPGEEAPVALNCALSLISRLARQADSGELLLMEVEEPGNPRRSCDINVYDAGLRMHQIADLFGEVVANYALPEARVRAVFDGAKDRALGHLSAGVGRDGREFVTIYFGVEAH